MPPIRWAVVVLSLWVSGCLLEVDLTAPSGSRDAALDAGGSDGGVLEAPPDGGFVDGGDPDLEGEGDAPDGGEARGCELREGARCQTPGPQGLCPDGSAPFGDVCEGQGVCCATPGD